MKNLLLIAIRGYQILVSPLLGQRCRFLPSCSHYAIEAISVHGSVKGSFLAVKRVCRCHPFHAGGLDPVPGTEEHGSEKEPEMSQEQGNRLNG